MLETVQHVILVKSVKGGVGKSTISTQLALSLWAAGYKVGLLDIDLCGPSIPYLLNLEDKDVYQGVDGRWVPIYNDADQRFAVMSIAYLLKSRNDPVIWRGPKKTAMIRQFLNDIQWGDLDYLVIDTPPGTSDEHITIMECMKDVTQAAKCDGAIVVTTPQEVSLEDARKEITFCRKTGIHILGIVENMSGFVCPNCTTCTNIFSSGGGQILAERAGVKMLGALPIDPRVAVLARSFAPVTTEMPTSTSAAVFRNIIQELTKSG